MSNVEQFLFKEEGPIFDVRSPSEFQHGSIPGSLSLPLFSDEERHLVGCCYKQKGKEEAIQLGLSFVGPKLSFFAHQFIQHKKIRLLCFRGGMRSSSMAWLASLVGCSVVRLDKGYKSYRAWVLEQFQKPISTVVLSGPTGSGKTELLSMLKANGYPILDLEAIAHHRGSVFGGYSEKQQPTQEQFENNLAHALYPLFQQPYFYAEAESRTIGKLVVPQCVYNAVHNAPLIAVECPFEERVLRIVEQYGTKSKEELIACIAKLERRLGMVAMKEAIAFVEQGNLKEATRVLLHYYDSSYTHCLTRHTGRCTNIPRQELVEAICSGKINKIS